MRDFRGGVGAAVDYGDDTIIDHGDLDDFVPGDGQHGILASSMLRDSLMRGTIVIDPLREQNIKGASVDLVLGGTIRVYRKPTIDLGWRPTGAPYGWNLFPARGVLGWIRGPIDAAEEIEVRTYELTSGDAFLVKPGIGYLMHTAERIRSDIYEPVIDGKSSIGRLFVKVHETAGYGDPGFNGVYTLEVTAQQPTILYIGMRIAQVRFTTLCGTPDPYQGNYVGRTAAAAVPSRSWAQLAADGIRKRRR